MKTIKDYLYLYVPCKCIRTDINREMLLVGIEDYGENWHPDDKCIKFEGAEWKWSAVETYIKPILRPMSNMTDDEIRELEKIGDFSVSGEHHINYKRMVKTMNEAEKIRYLLRKNFDVFGLIEESIAVSSLEV